MFLFVCFSMHANEGAPRHHAGAPGPFLYLKPRSERVRSRAQRDPPPPLSPEKPPPREAREPLLSRRAEFPVFTVPPGKASSPEPRPGSPRAEGEGRGQPGRGKAGSARTRARKRRDARTRGGGVRGTESGRKEPPRPHNGSAGAEQNAPAAPRGPAAPPRPRGYNLRGR